MARLFFKDRLYLHVSIMKICAFDLYQCLLICIVGVCTWIVGIFLQGHIEEICREEWGGRVDNAEMALGDSNIRPLRSLSRSVFV